MSKPSPQYFDLVERWILGGVTIEKVIMSPDQRYRSLAAYEAYQIWLQDKQIRPTDIMRRIAAREYPIILKKAESGDPTAQEYARALNLVPGKQRTITEISNDVALFNHLIGVFDTPTENIEKAKVMDASDWLIREGMKMGDARAVKSGADIKMQMNNNFQEKESPTDQMPNVEINITGDVSVIKRDRVNYTDEEKKKYARQYGLTQKQVQELVQQPDGSWEIPSDNAEPNPDLNPDIFIANEE